MTGNTANLSDGGWQGAGSRFKGANDEAEIIAQAAKDQQGVTYAGNKGSLATNMQNGSVALADMHGATSKMQNSDAVRGVNFVKQGAQSESDAADETHHVSTQAASHVSEIHNKIIPS